ncbi:hypothetical protein K435DRAFT_669587 [Dendrothele bispora CBS 962.96]|uniref:Uncharacterized protein n=1 Tax=Dendrothele bispora (strain CBS 962.96) TaxID=1314807 RepID=A0A4S8LVY7_DENBC|nr:hypothetical protein K435DRAFT_669587 [Dendrothele bispora CBS 962.96]
MPRTLSSLENQTRTPLPPSPEKVSPPSPEQLKDPSPEPENIPEFVYFNTEPNEFGIYRSYPKLPKKLPDEEIPLDEVCEGPGFPSTQPSEPLSVFGTTSRTLSNTFAPFLNATVFRLMSWFYNGRESKSMADLDELVKDVLQAEDFKKEDLDGFSSRNVSRDMDEWLGPEFHLPAEDGWVEGSVEIPLPAEGVKCSESEAPRLTVDGIFYRKPLEVIKSVFQSERSQNFHYVPFKLFHRRDSQNDVEPPLPSDTRLHHELYNSDAYIQEYERIQLQQHQRQLNDPSLRNETDIENVPVGIMCWSDETQVTQFGDQSMWPIYMYFGNQSKYERAKPTSFAAHHLSYIPKLPSNIQDYYQKKFGFPASGPTLTHLKRELMQAIWSLLLDPEFMHAYEHGILVKCGDGVIRRLFPRFFTYSADYPEKVLLASIRSLGRCPCPHCLVEKDQIRQLGTRWDRQRRETKPRIDTEKRRSLIERMRKWIFSFGYKVVSQAVETFLQPYSYVPTVNTFSERFHKFDVNFFLLFVPDVLHELELGVWKAVFIHLIRILFAYGNDTVQKLDERYRQVPTFGRDTIRKFRNNASAMKHLAARDFEDMLQTSIPVFEGLVHEHDVLILNLLFDLAVFHCLAKFRLHSEDSIQMLDEGTTNLGKSLRLFDEKVCNVYNTKEIPKETAARGRRNAKKANEGSAKGKRKSTTADAIRKRFNLCTYKIHALGHYVQFIRLYGTTDNYTTQIGELEHRRVKRFYARTNRTFTFVRQVASQEKHKRVVESVKLRQIDTSSPAFSRLDSDSLPPVSPRLHYAISDDSSMYKSVPLFMEENIRDPSVKDFYRKLKEHLYSRLSGKIEGEEISLSQRGLIDLRHDRIYFHKVLRVNYTTYDMRRSQDSINPRTHSDIIVRSSDPDTPYWYARVLGIFHADVKYGKQPYRQMDFLWVRWFVNDACQDKFDLRKRKLPRVHFIDALDDCAFGFVDPNNVIRAAHLIPAFHFGRTKSYMGQSVLGRRESDGNEDWVKFYVGVFSDRDMFARFVPGLGLGHSFHRTNQRCEEEEVILEDGVPDAIDSSAPLILPADPPVDQLNEVNVDMENEDELMDYGYVGSDSDDSEVGFDGFQDDEDDDCHDLT